MREAKQSGARPTDRDPRRSRQRALVILTLVAGVVVLGSCRAVLGIDDGVPAADGEDANVDATIDGLSLDAPDGGDDRTDVVEDMTIDSTPTDTTTIDATTTDTTPPDAAPDGPCLGGSVPCSTHAECCSGACTGDRCWDGTGVLAKDGGIRCVASGDCSANAMCCSNLCSFATSPGKCFCNSGGAPCGWGGHCCSGSCSDAGAGVDAYGKCY